MMKKIRQLTKTPPEGMLYAHRLEGKVKNVGIKPVRKPKKEPSK